MSSMILRVGLFPQVKSASYILRHSVLLKADGHLNEYNWQKQRIGKREIVGPTNGPYSFLDSTDRPYPSLRFRADDAVIGPIRQKELGDWKAMSLEDKKLLYRYSFKRTMSELLNWNHYTKLYLSYFFLWLSFGMMILILLTQYGYAPLPQTLNDDYRNYTMRNKLILEKSMIEGAAAKYDYENDRWKD